MPDTLLALVDRTRLSAVLTAFHREGYGHVMRVLDPDRVPLANQLGRAGVPTSRLADGQLEGVVLLLVRAPGRTAAAAGLAVAHGAQDVELVTSGQSVPASIAPGLIASAGNRRGHRSSRPVDTVPDLPAELPPPDMDSRNDAP